MNSDLQELGGHDPHDVLGVPAGANRQEVAKAFRRSAAHGVHPDAGGDEQAFRQLARARDILLDARRLAAYTAAAGGTAAAGTPTGGTPSGRTPPGGTPTTPRKPDPAAPPHQPAPPTRRTKLHPLLFVAVALTFGGPLLWPLAVLTGLIALGLGSGPRQPQPS